MAAADDACRSRYILHLGILTNEQKEYNNMKNMFDMFSVLPTHYDVLYLTLSMYYV